MRARIDDPSVATREITEAIPTQLKAAAKGGAALLARPVIGLTHFVTPSTPSRQITGPRPWQQA